MLRKGISFTALLTLILLLGGCNSHIGKTLLVKESASASILFKGVNIFDGRDSVLRMEQDVLIENGEIKQIAKFIPNDGKLRVIDAQGQTLMPGMIDAHVHLSGSGAMPWENYAADKAYNLKAYLYAGVTTVYDLGGLAGDIGKLAKKVAKGKLPGPAIYHTHIPITVRNSHPIPLTEEVLPWPLKKMVNGISPTIERAEDAPKVIQKYLQKEVDYVKIACDQIPPGSAVMADDLLKSLIDAAHQQHKKVFVHIGSPENAISAINAGADILAHGVWRGKLSPEQADIIAAANVPIIYTLAAFQNVNQINKGAFQPSEMDKQLVSEKILQPVTCEKGKDVQQQTVMRAFFEDVSKNEPDWLSNFKLLLDRNVPILIGTDSNLPGTYAGATYLQELDALHAFSLSNFQILRAATYGNAHLFLAHPDFGMIAEGKKADLLLLNGNPLQDLSLVKEPVLILAAGRVYKRK